MYSLPVKQQLWRLLVTDFFGAPKFPTHDDPDDEISCIFLWYFEIVIGLHISIRIIKVLSK